MKGVLSLETAARLSAGTLQSEIHGADKPKAIFDCSSVLALSSAISSVNLSPIDAMRLMLIQQVAAVAPMAAVTSPVLQLTASSQRLLSP